ncbi:IspD/TarI family cytidylyltransferase [Bacteroides caecigallinarum]|uniref:IspD/TarI family cytidylyltransferase n=1 Tax=Bacteroides caecigallinarum TaxID=1411144 RepID=UPI001F38DDCB|nr:IspD/TarI family cytidylyltransferase [Bacteroides caecigallinarum]MCF2583433.1 2-C-methyl-D-erythritol 4-phosphate cytidylyltransferase [Bacteroides caecigallinarum]
MNIALLTAAGNGTRMGQDIPKQFMTIDDCPIIIYTMLPFQEHEEIDEIAVVCLAGWENSLKAYSNQFGITKLKYIFPGGSSNQGSIHNGILGLKEAGYSDEDIILIQDGVRPLVSADIITNNINVCKKYGYAITGLMCKEVIMEFKPENEVLGYISIPRERLVRTQTPHTYKLGIILDIHKKAEIYNLDMTASCELAAKLGINDQHLVLGNEKNGLKLTNVEDIELFKALKHVSKYPWLK